MNPKFLFYTVVVSLLSTSQIRAQENQEADASKTHWEIGANFTNQTVFNGRKDSVNLPYISPTLYFYHKSVLFISASTSFLTTDGRADLFYFSGGYQFSINKFDGEISAEKSFYNSQS